MKKLLVFLTVLSIFFLLPAKVLASGAPVQSNSNYISPSNKAPSDGTSTETISLHLQDSDQNNVVGDVISLSSSNDSTATFTQNNQTTDGSGNATFTVATTTPGDVKVTLYDSTNNVTFTDWFTLAFYDASKGCANVPAAPVLSSVVSNSNNTATLNWTDSANPVSNYLISYGTSTGKYIYGNPNVGSQGTISYTIGSLAGNKKYYFVVAASNNCGISSFSNEISAVVKPIASTATPVPIIRPTVTPASTPTALVTDIATNIPEPTDTATPTPSNKNVNSTFRILAIVIIGVGVLLIGSVFIFQKIKTKKRYLD